MVQFTDDTSVASAKANPPLSRRTTSQGILVFIVFQSSNMVGGLSEDDDMILREHAHCHCFS